MALLNYFRMRGTGGILKCLYAVACLQFLLFGCATMHERLSGNMSELRSYIDKGGDLNIKTEWGETLLMYAARDGRHEIVKLLLDKGADINAKTKNYGDTALMEAANHNYTEIVKLLMDKGADINAANTCGSTAWTLALVKGFRETAKLIIDKGAEIPAGIGILIRPMDVPIIEINGNLTPIGEWFKKRQPQKFGMSLSSLEEIFGNNVLNCSLPRESVTVLPPGSHNIKVIYYRLGDKGGGEVISLSINAEKGGMYIVKYRRTMNEWRAWIEKYE